MSSSHDDPSCDVAHGTAPVPATAERVLVAVFASPVAGYNLPTYSKAHGLGYESRLGPLPVEHFLGYADWFTANLVPGLRDDQVTELTPAGGGFVASFAGGEAVAARQVVIATGVRPYRNIPPGNHWSR